MTNTEKAIAIIFELVISFLLLCIVIVARKDLSENQKGLLIVCSMLFWVGSFISVFTF